jgi:hypothetical protein
LGENFPKPAAGREIAGGLESYRWPARVWSPRGTARILGVRACGHAAHIQVRQHGGGGGHGGRRELLAPPRRASRERMQRGKERWGKGCPVDPTCK